MTTDNTISFREDMIDLILAGKKTVTIRPMKPQPDVFFFGNIPGTRKYFTLNGDHTLREASWFRDQYPHGKVGDVVTVRGHDGCKLRITDIWFNHVDNLLPIVWRCDGIRDTSDPSIEHHWDSFYGGTEYRWENCPMVWVVEFVLVKAEVKP